MNKTQKDVYQKFICRTLSLSFELFLDGRINWANVYLTIQLNLR